MKKLFSLVAILTLVFTQGGLVYAAVNPSPEDLAKQAQEDQQIQERYAMEGRMNASQAAQDQLNDANQAYKDASRNYDIAKAYSEYLQKPDDEGTLKRLGALLFPNDTDFGKDKAASRQKLFQNGKQAGLLSAGVVTQGLNVWSEPEAAPKDGPSVKVAGQGTEASKKVADQAYIVQSVAIRNKNSEDLANKLTEEKSPDVFIADSIRRAQDLSDLKRLGCEKDASLPGCQSLMQAYNNRCATYNNSRDQNKTVACESLKTTSSGEGKQTLNLSKATQASTQNVSKIETAKMDQLKKKLETQTVNVSNILSFKDPKTFFNGEPKSLQTNYVTEGGALYFISRMIDVLVILVSSVAVVTLIIGGYMFMFSGGDEQQRENGKDVLIYTVFGLIFVYASYAIISLIQGLIYF